MNGQSQLEKGDLAAGAAERDAVIKADPTFYLVSAVCALPH